MMTQSIFDALNVRPGIKVYCEGLRAGFGVDIIEGALADVISIDNDSDPVYLTGDEILFRTIDPTGTGRNTLRYRMYFTDGTIRDDYLTHRPTEPVMPEDIDQSVEKIVFYDDMYSPTFTEGYFKFNAQVYTIFDAMMGAFSSAPAYLSGDMNADYLTSHGMKTASPAVMLWLRKYGHEIGVPGVRVLSMNGLVELGKQIVRRFADSWQKIYDALTAEYRPLENYSMTEETTPDLTDTFGVSDDYEKNVHRELNSKTTTTDQNKTTDASVYGFNSSDPVPASKMVGSGSVESVADVNDNFSDEKETQVGSRVETHTGKSTLTRSGNIGVTTSQQMLESEIALRVKNHMEDIIFSNIDEILTTAGFSPIRSEEIFII